MRSLRDSIRTRFRLFLCLFLFVSGAYLYAFPAATISYGATVILHVVFGALLAAILVRPAMRLFRGDLPAARAGWSFLLAGAAIGLALVIAGTPRALHGWLYLHIGLSVVGCVLLLGGWLGRGGWLRASAAQAVLRHVLLLLVFLPLTAGAWWMREVPWHRAYRIENPPMPPASMDGEGDGPSGRYFPSSAQTAHGGTIPSDFFLQSESCRRCHADIYEQWKSSAHHFSTFNNQWYRKSIEYMQDVAGVRPSKWCAGCHDPALLFTGLFDRPVREQLDRPEAQAGLACVVCHSIQKVKSTMGQGDYVLEYPKLHELVTSRNPLVRSLHDFLVHLNPEPHRRTFLKPFVRDETPQFCSVCHKVHLDVPVDRYRWIRGFNEYDNWQASGVSGEGARSFYYPVKAQRCAGCHMPLVPSHDAGNVNGFVHSHRFPAANTALPVANGDQEQLQATEQFLKDKNVSVDIFALAPAEPVSQSVEAPGPQMATTFAVGEEAEAALPRAEVPRALVTAPLDRVPATVRRGGKVRVDVVVRTLKVGHFFPGGTVDAFDCWLEFEAKDEKGQVLLWSGKVEEDGKGPVEKGAHFYRSLQIDGHGNPINKRNAWATRAVVYVRLIPPGAADTVHYLLPIAQTAGARIQLTARLNYRKFSWYNTQFSFAGVRDPADPNPAVTPGYDDGRWLFTGSTEHVSGKLHQIPVLPIETLAENTVTLRVVPPNAPAPQAERVLRPEDRNRWNDYGIGLLLQGDLRGAAEAFQNVTEINPQNADGWVNLGRVALQEGNLEKARFVLEKALSLSRDLARAHFFYARVLKEEGRYDEAIQHLRQTLDQYPRDRVVRNELGRVLFLERRYQDAVQEFESVLRIDPEDLQAHYTLMLCYNGLGQKERAREHQERYLRFKADEASQALTGAYRQKHPEDNNERQPIHLHVSAPLDPRQRAPFDSAQPGAAKAFR